MRHVHVVVGYYLLSANDGISQPRVSLPLKGKPLAITFVLETPSLIRYGELTNDEYFVTQKAATEGVTITNTGLEPIVMLKHFAENPELNEFMKTE